MTTEGCLTSKDSTPNKILVAGCFTDVDIPENDGRIPVYYYFWGGGSHRVNRLFGEQAPP